MVNDQAQQNQPRIHWQFPPAAKFGRVIPKEKLYQQVGANAELKQLFIEQVGQIKWAYKLAESTINLAKTEQVDELEVIHIKLKTHSLDEKILTAIDKAIPHPTIFMLSREAKKEEQEQIEIAYQAAHKLKLTTPSNKEKWQQSIYLKSQWITPASQLAEPLPGAINLERLYHQLLEALMPLDVREGQDRSELHEIREATKPFSSQSSVPSLVKSTQQGGLKLDKPDQNKRSLEEKLAAIAAIAVLNKQIKQTKIKRDKEKQFNRKLELNDQFKALKKQLAELKGE